MVVLMIRGMTLSVDFQPAPVSVKLAELALVDPKSVFGFRGDST